MKLTVKKSISQLKAGTVCTVFLTAEQSQDPYAFIPDPIQDAISSIDISFFKGKQGECFFIPLKRTPSLILCGLGNSKDISLENMRLTGASLAGFCSRNHISALHCLTAKPGIFAEEECIHSITEGLALASYSFTKKSRESDDTVLTECTIYSEEKSAEQIIDQIQIISDNADMCRDLINGFSYDATPERIASLAKELSSDKNIKCQILGKKQLEDIKAGLILAVNQGSSRPPQMVIMTYKGNPASKDWTAIVGKGITFDSGGMNLKSNGHIENMRNDMAGAATVMFTLKSLSELGIKQNVYAVMPLTENMISSTAYRPGDMFTAYNGLTVEIGNTDAEGRLILADAIAYTADRLKPSRIIDLATLTGACVVTFGETVAAFLSTDKQLTEELKKASAETGEKIWQLPLFREFEDHMKSETADLNNMSSEKNAGTIHGAAFLKNFTEGIPWAHLDIAGTAWASKARGYFSKNATAWGMRLLISFFRNAEKKAGKKEKNPDEK